MSDAKRFRWVESEPVHANARAVLPALAHDYFEAGRKLLGKKSTSDKLHRFRLKTKQFRYTLELFRDSYGPSLERRLELLKPVQSALGDINDCAATLEVLDGRMPRHAQRVKDFLDKRAAKKTEEFEKYWRGTFDAPGQSKAWVDYLTRFAR